MNALAAAIVACFLASGAGALQIGPLLSTCIDACQRGCVEIRAVQAQREQEGGGALQVELKDSGDARSALTEADGAAQRAIVGALRAEWGPSLRIIGEEDGDDELATEIASAVEAGAFEPLRRDLLEDDIYDTPELDASEVIIYVDPLDGTREV